MIINLISLVVTAGLLGLIAWRLFGGRDIATMRGHGIRHFFQYGTQYLLLFLSGVGVTGLIGRLLGRSTELVGGQSDLALDIAFTAVGVPLLVVVALWTRRLLIRDESESKSLAWVISSTASTLTALAFTMIAAFNVGLWIAQLKEFDGFDVAELLVWSVLLVNLWMIDRANTSRENSRPHLFMGSGVGLIVTGVALANTMTATAEILLHTSGQTIYSDNLAPLWRGLILAAVGIPVWALYWFENAQPTKRDGLWYGYTLLVGTAGGLITAVTAGSAALFRALVWFIGDPTTTSAAQHFRDVPAAASAAVVGAGIWWYHRDQMVTPGPRNEIDRVFDYAMSAIGLIATGVGIGLAIVAAIEGLTSATVLTGGSVMNALLLATTLLLVGTPIWGTYWQRIQAHVAENREEELTAPTRRGYLFLLFGLGGVAAIVALVTGVYLFADDVLNIGLTNNTYFRMRYALGTLVATGGMAGYHWLVYDRERDAMRAIQTGPRYVLLVGPKDEALEHAITRATGGRVHTWPPTNGFTGVWTRSAVLREVELCEDDTLILFAEGSRLLAVPVERD